MAGQPLGGSWPLNCCVFQITFRHVTVGRTPLDEGSARLSDNTQRAGFEPAIPASKWPQPHALDCATTGDRQESSYDAMENGSLVEFHNMLRFNDKELSALRIQPLFGCLYLLIPTYWRPYSPAGGRLLFRWTCSAFVTSRKASGQEGAWKNRVSCKDNIKVDPDMQNAKVWAIILWE